MVEFVVFISYLVAYIVLLQGAGSMHNEMRICSSFLSLFFFHSIYCSPKRFIAKSSSATSCIRRPKLFTESSLAGPRRLAVGGNCGVL